MDPIAESKPGETRCREDQAVVSAGIQFFQSRDHVATHVFELEMGEVVAQLGEPSQGAARGAQRPSTPVAAHVRRAGLTSFR